MSNDSQLLHEYATAQSQPAFAELARRYVDLVYASARRQVGDAHLAEDVTQAVFIVLAQKARSVPKDRPMSGWLLKVTKYCASNARRARMHRETHERRAAEMMPSTIDDQVSESEWETLSPLLDEALFKLRPADRDAVLLKFFEKKTLQQIGEALGVSEAAAEKRVSRAVEKLRASFKQKGVAVASTALAGVLAARSTQAAPSALAQSVQSSTAAGASSAAVLAKGAIIIMATKKTTAAVIVVLLLLLGVGGAAIAIKAMSSDSKIVVPQSEPAKGSVATFADGTTIHILGITEAPEDLGSGNAVSSFLERISPSSQPSTWWNADGTSAAPVSLQGMGNVYVGNGVGNHGIRIVYAMRGPGAANRAGLTIRVNGANGGSASSSKRSNNELLVNFVASVPATSGQTSIRFGLASGPWREDASTEISDDGSTTQLKGDPMFTSVTEEGGVCVVDLNMNRPLMDDRETRTVAILKNGKEVDSQSWNGLANGHALLSFPCSKAEISKMAWRTRPYEWATIGNVALIPAASK